MHSVEKTVATAEELLASRFGGVPELTQAEDLGGSGASLVLRCRVSPNPFLQERTVVIKQLPDLADVPREEEEHKADELALIREVVAYQYTNTLPGACRPGPLLLAYDLAQRMLILSDAGDGANYAEVLQWDDAQERKSAIRKLGRALGTMHASTFGGAESYNTLLRRQCQKMRIDPETVVDSDIDIANLIREGMDLLQSFGLALEPAVAYFAHEAMERQGRATVRAFTPFDLTPDNIMVNKQVVFLDFEWASFRDIAFDVACVVVGFPQDSGTPALTDDECQEFLAAWSAEISSVWPEAKDMDTVEVAVMAALVGWAFMSLVMLHHGQKMSRKAARRALSDSVRVYGDFPELTEKKDVNALAPEQTSDMATTIDAIYRFACRRNHERFAEVAAFTQHLQGLLARQGGHPVFPPAS